MADRERLYGELGGGSGESGTAAGTVRKVKFPGALPARVASLQDRLRAAREAEFTARFEAQRLVIAQKQSALKAAEAILAKLEQTRSIVGEQEGSLKALYQKGFGSRMEWQEKDKELLSLQHDVEAQKKQVALARDSLAEEGKKLAALEREREKAILADIVEREKAIASIEGEAVKARKRYEMERLVSPVEGTVHGLSMHTIGGIVRPAQDVVSVVPDGTPLVVEAVVLNKDIGFVRVGQETEVKLDTFSFQKYGTIRGQVLSISPDAIEDEKQGPVYRMRSSLERASLSVDGREAAVAPGMAASVEVKTGKRRVIEFFLSPLVKYAREGLTLR